MRELSCSVMCCVDQCAIGAGGAILGSSGPSTLNRVKLCFIVSYCFYSAGLFLPEFIF